ncbi:MAG TPA: IPT/TIG domain-containing protein [Bryobacteraceae bacterium]|jgi:YD repeat-containing protein|nr:IPT/TIG domain-containing protein [Bryobacteraceae bacterium]
MHRLAALVALFLSAAAGQQSFRYFYDSNGQLFRVLDASGNLVEYDYDSSGNATHILRSTLALGSLAILNLAPQRGNAGATVTIYGQNFSSVSSGDTVLFNGVTATVVSASPTAIVVQVPSGVSTGPVSITVAGNTVTSGTLNFTVPGVPVITSISPAFGYPGQTVSISVQGSGLTGATYAFLGAGGIGVSDINVASDSSASFTATIGQVGGVFVLVGTGDNGPGSSVPALANTFRVYQSPGNNFTSTRLAIFNTYYPASSQPGVPTGSHAAAQTLSIFNGYIAPGSQPGVPAGSHAARQTLAVFNGYIAPGTEPGVPAGSHAALQTLSIFNSRIAPGSQPGVPAGSRYAFEMLSAQNDASSGSMGAMLTIRPLLATSVSDSVSANSTASRLISGQTVAIDISLPAGYLPQLDFRVNGAVLASSASGSLQTYFTVPYGLKSLTFEATGESGYGQSVSSGPQEMAVAADVGTVLSGRALDGDGRPLPGAALRWQANGLTAEYYRFAGALDSVPDLTGMRPVRTGYVSALNYPNPQEVFGADPMGVGLGPDYAVRFSGKLSIASAGDYRFQLNAQPGARLTIDGMVAINGQMVTLAAGDHQLEAIYYESGAGAAAQLLWTPPGGTQGVVPPSALVTSGAAGAAAADGSYRLNVPAALTGAHVVVVDHSERN